MGADTLPPREKEKRGGTSEREKLGDNRGKRDDHHVRRSQRIPVAEGSGTREPLDYTHSSTATSLSNFYKQLIVTTHVSDDGVWGHVVKSYWRV